MFKYLSCLMIRSRTLIDADSTWTSSEFFEWKDKMKVIDHSWFFCSRRSWISLICSIFFFVVRRRSYSSDWTSTFRFSLDVESRSDDVSTICAFCAFDDVVVSETCSILDNVVVFDRVAVGLGWTRARASNPRVGQGWTHLICPGGLDGFGFLSDGLDRTSTFGRADWSGSSSCPTDWIGQAYLSVGRSTRISAHTKSSDWKANPRVDHQILSDELNWTDNSVRRVELDKQFCPSPSSELARVSWS
jgi:hypothetical protein